MCVPVTFDILFWVFLQHLSATEFLQACVQDVTVCVARSVQHTDMTQILTVEIVNRTGY